MRTLRGLMIKDLLNLKSYSKNIILMTALFFGLSYFMDSLYMLTIYITICLGMVGVNSFAYDGGSNADRYMLTTPVNKAELVRAKYLLCFLCDISGCALGIALTLPLLMIKSSWNTASIISTLITGFSAVLCVMLLQIFQIPILYWFGYEKGKYIQIVVILLVIAAITAFTVGSLTATGSTIRDFMEALYRYIVYIAAAAIILLYLLSYALSVTIYRKKEV